MPHERFTLLTAKIRKLGYAPHEAERLAGFLVMSMALVCAFMDELAVPRPAAWEWNGHLDTFAAEPFNVTVLPAAYSIQR
jgi:hypothetical protein